VRNVQGQAYALSVLAPVVSGHERRLRDEVARLPRGAASPFGRIQGTHFARLVVVPWLEAPSGAPAEPRESFLMLSAEFDGTLDHYVEGLRTVLAAETDALWRHCVGFPGTAGPDAFRRWLLSHQIPTGFSVVSYGRATVAEVRDSLRLRERLTAFALRAQDLEPAELKRAWLAEFGEETL
jgi:hypothetical protein